MRRGSVRSTCSTILPFLVVGLCALSTAVATAVAAAEAPAGAKGSAAEVKPALPRIPDRTFNLADFGGVGDGNTWNTGAFQKALAKINEAGGGRLVVPKGVYRTGPITLVSQLDLHLDEGAVVQAPDTFADYGLPDPQTLTSEAEVRAKVKVPAPLVYGRDLHDVAITGPGAIDGAGAIWWAWSERASRKQPGRLVYPRQKMVVIEGCDRLRVEGVTLRNSPMFHLVPRDVTDLTVERVKILSPADAPNSDAIDPSGCVNALIRDCDLDVGDDDVAIKGGKRVENVLIEDCRIKHGHGISIGSETAGGVRNMLVRRCTFEQTDNGIRIKSMRGAGGVVQGIRYADVHMKDVGYAIVLDLLYVDNNRPNFRGDPDKVPSIRDVEISDVTIDGARYAGKIVGLPDSPITGVTLRNVQITADTDLVTRNTDRLLFDHVSLKIKDGERNKQTVVDKNGDPLPTTRP